MRKKDIKTERYIAVITACGRLGDRDVRVVSWRLMVLGRDASKADGQRAIHFGAWHTAPQGGFVRNVGHKQADQVLEEVGAAEITVAKGLINLDEAVREGDFLTAEMPDSLAPGPVVRGYGPIVFHRNAA